MAILFSFCRMQNQKIFRMLSVKVVRKLSNVHASTVAISLKKKPLLDENWELKVHNLQPLQKITLVSRVTTENDARYCAHAHYVSDSCGTVDVSTMEARSGGSYEGVEPMGLVWSQSQEPGQKPGLRIIKFDARIPMVTNIYVLDGFHKADECLSLIARRHWLSHGVCERMYIADGVSRIEVRRGQLKGTMFIPEGSGPFPGVVDLFGTVGGIMEHRSALLASRGIASLTIQYYSPKEAKPMLTNLDVFEEAIDHILSHPKVRKPHAGIIGNSKGGEMAMFTTSLCHKIRACVSVGAPHMLCTDAMTYKGKTYPAHPICVDKLKRTPEGLVMEDFWDTGDEDISAYQLKVEDNPDARYLLINGEDDRCVGPEVAEWIAERLAAAGRTGYRLLVYPGAGHQIEPPHSPVCAVSYTPVFRELSVWGGKPRQHARAQEAVWREILAFFKEDLSKS